MEKNVRLTGGEFSGQKIATPGGATHPMGERERLALFNMLGDLSNARVLDLFAGGGTLGFEALSRGASNASFVEKERNVCKVIRQNAEKLGVAQRCEILCSRVGTSMPLASGTYDVVFADPPYDKYNESMLDGLAKYVERDGIFVLSHPNEAPEIDGFELSRTRQYAGAHLSLYHKHD